MKKIIILLLTVLAAVTFAACDKENQSIDNSDFTEKTEDNNSDENGANITYFEDDYVPKYNDILYDSAVDWIGEDFQNENAVRVTGFIDDEPETRLPATRTFIVADSVEFENIFIENIEELEVDFDNEMLIVYTFGTEYVLSAFILDMDLSGGTLTVDYTIPSISEAGSAAQPFQRWFVIRLDKSEVTTAVFNETATYYKK